MKIAICGITGFTGRSASRFLSDLGHEVIGIGRSDLASGISNIQEILKDTDAIINLSGAPILKRWTAKYKKEIYNSRINTTRVLVEAMNGMRKPPKTFISASAVGIYNNQNSHNEHSNNFSNNFLGTVCKDWEAEALKINSSVRLCIFRLGVVLSHNGGALKKMLIPFNLGLGGRIGNGVQHFPFIHSIDLNRFFYWAISTESANGVYNLVAPHVVTNKEFTAALGKQLHRPVFMPVPVVLLKLIFGEASQTLVVGQQVVPNKLLNEAFAFQFPTLELTLQSIFSKA